MSYCRFSNADAYIFDDVMQGLVCCGCWLEDGLAAFGNDVDTTLAHIAKHRAAGHNIPTWVDNLLEEDRESLEVAARGDGEEA